MNIWAGGGGGDKVWEFAVSLDLLNEHILIILEKGKFCFWINPSCTNEPPQRFFKHNSA